MEAEVAAVLELEVLDLELVMTEAEAEGALRFARGAVRIVPAGHGPGPGEADAGDFADLARPFVIDEAAAGVVEPCPDHEPIPAAARIDDMIIYPGLGHAVGRDDVDAGVEFGKHVGGLFRRHAVGPHEDAVFGRLEQLGLHRFVVAEGVVRRVEIDNAGGGFAALLDAGHAERLAFEVGEQLGGRVLEGDGAGQVFGDGVGVAEDRGEADGQLAVAGDESEAQGLDPGWLDQFVRPAVVQLGTFYGFHVHRVKFEPTLTAIRQDK